MRIHFNTNIAELALDLKYRAIATGAASALIDKLDEMADALVNLPAECAEFEEAQAKAEKDRDNLYNELEDLVNCLIDNLPDKIPQRVENGLKIARAALERHGK